MDTSDWIAIVLFLLGLIGIGLGYFLNSINESIKEVKYDIGKVAEDISDMKPKVKVLWEDEFSAAHSPRQLNSRGSSILEDSGIKQIVELKKDKLLKILKNKNLDNPYDAEKAIMHIMEDLPKHCPEVVDDLKTGAFNNGVTTDVLLFVGGLHLRNLVFEELGFSLKDLDKTNS